MMDPITALGAASSIVQLVDFVQGLIHSTYKIFKSPSGRTKANVDLDSITTSLTMLNDDLMQSVKRATAGSSKQLSSKDVELLELCQNCRVVAAKLLAALNKLKAQKLDSFWHSFGRALLTVWKEKELASMKGELDTYRQQISLHISVSIRYNAPFLSSNGLANISLSGNRLVAYRMVNPATDN